ncbi:ABC-1 domain protein, partial [mine drainage metagenome]
MYISISSIMKEFGVRVFEEMDYRREMSNARKIAKNIQGREKIIIPTVYEEITSSRVLVMDYIPGIKITNRKELLEKGIDVKKLAMDLDTAFIRMLLRDDIFHADPHPGN